MIKCLGENLKSLRRKMDLTQEDLANILNVSVQSISRWETNMGYPDIELLPAIANFFNTTIDFLLGLDITKKNEKIEMILKDIYDCKTKGELKRGVEIAREGLNEFPNNYQIMSSLSSCLFNLGETDEEKRQNNQEVIVLCESILQGSTDDSIRQYAMQLLCYTYPKFNQKDKAMQIAQSLPNYFVTANELLKPVISEDEKINHLHGNLYSLIQLVARNIEDLFIYTKNNSEKIAILESLLKIYQGFFDQEDYYFFHCYMTKFYRYLAFLHADTLDIEKTLNCLEKATYHALSYDTRPETHTYTSAIFKGVNDSLKNSVTSSTNNQAYVLLNKLSDEQYDFIRAHPQFITLTNKLKDVARK